MKNRDMNLIYYVFPSRYNIIHILMQNKTLYTIFFGGENSALFILIGRAVVPDIVYFLYWRRLVRAAVHHVKCHGNSLQESK